jgi:uncharacterized protein
MPPRVVATEAAADLLKRMAATYGPLLLHQSGGCCEGTAPMCFRRADFQVSAQDVLIGTIGDCPVFVGRTSFAYLAWSQLIIDVTDGGTDSFSLEAADGVRFTTRSRLFTDAEAAELKAVPG